MILIGELSMWVALLFAGWGCVVSYAGGALRRADLAETGERAIYMTWAFVGLASLGLWTALVQHDFTLRYVASYTSANLPRLYTLTAFWAGQEGSMLFWALILSTYAAITVRANRGRNRALMPYVCGTVSAVTLFFLATLCFGASPFRRLPYDVFDGNGLNPQLQNPGMAFHPPNLYLGYVATTIPFAFAIAALITRRLDGEWLAAVRRWALVSWFFLTVGITLGMWWAYVELGWGGYWMWDPVENASLLPWLGATAFLHSVMMQEKKGMMKVWNMVLVAATFFLCIYGTFLTRSGIISSVHAFAESPIGKYFVGFLALGIAATVWLILDRMNYLKSEAELESVVSRESSFLFNNLILLASCFAVLWGTMFPVLSEKFSTEKISLDAVWFNRLMVPIGLFLLFLTGVGPLFAWRRTSMESLRKNFQWPGIGMLVVVAALVIGGMRYPYSIISLGTIKR